MTEKQKAKIRDGNRSTSRRGIIAMVRNYEDHGIQASASYRQTGLQVSSENQMLRAMIQRAGISDHETTHYLRTAPPLSREVLDSYPYEERDPLEAQADRQAFAIVPQPPNEPDLSQARVSRRPQTWDGTNAGAQQSRPEGSSAVIGQHQHQHQSAAQGGMRQVFDEDNDQQLPYAGDSGYQSTNEDGNRGNRSLQLTNEHTSELHHGNGGFQFQSTNGHISLPPPHYGGESAGQLSNHTSNDQNFNFGSLQQFSSYNGQSSHQYPSTQGINAGGQPSYNGEGSRQYSSNGDQSSPQSFNGGNNYQLFNSANHQASFADNDHYPADMAADDYLNHEMDDQFANMDEDELDRRMDELLRLE